MLSREDGRALERHRPNFRGRRRLKRSARAPRTLRAERSQSGHGRGAQRPNNVSARSNAVAFHGRRPHERTSRHRHRPRSLYGLALSDPAAIGRQLTSTDELDRRRVFAHKPVSGHGTGTWMWDRRVGAESRLLMRAITEPRRTIDLCAGGQRQEHEERREARAHSSTG